MPEKRKTCPFCNSSKLIILVPETDVPFHRVECQSCLAIGPVNDDDPSESGAWDAWDDRLPEYISTINREAER